MAASVVISTVRRFRSTARSKALMSIPSTAAGPGCPTWFQTKSSPLKRVTASHTIRRESSSFVRSAGIPNALPPAAVISLTTRCTPAASTSTTATCAPSRAKRRAPARPIPEAAAVTIPIFPARRMAWSSRSERLSAIAYSASRCGVSVHVEDALEYNQTPRLPAQVSHQRHRPLDDVTHLRQPPRPRQVPSAAPEPDALQQLESHQPHELVSRSPERSGIGRRGRDAMTGCRKKRASGPTAPLAQREALRHSVADLATALEAARLLVYHAASLHAEGAECVSEVSMTERMITNTSAAPPRSVGATTPSRL